jgi:hypothetical protein
MMQLLKAALTAAVYEVATSTLHYAPLNGRSLIEIALKKRHHGNKRFLNPMGIPLTGRFRADR